MKVGNTDFREDLGKDLKFQDFKKKYEKALKGANLEEIYKKLQGKIVVTKKKEVKED